MRSNKLASSNSCKSRRIVDSEALNKLASSCDLTTDFDLTIVKFLMSFFRKHFHPSFHGYNSTNENANQSKTVKNIQKLKQS